MMASGDQRTALITASNPGKDLSKFQPFNADLVQDLYVNSFIGLMEILNSRAVAYNSDENDLDRFSMNKCNEWK